VRSLVRPNPCLFRVLFSDLLVVSMAARSLMCGSKKLLPSPFLSQVAGEIECKARQWATLRKSPLLSNLLEPERPAQAQQRSANHGNHGLGRRFDRQHCSGHLLCHRHGAMKSSPVVANATVCIGSDDDNVYALERHERHQAVEFHDWRSRAFLARHSYESGLSGKSRIGSSIWPRPGIAHRPGFPRLGS
jgi:hypothetical protein